MDVLPWVGVAGHRVVSVGEVEGHPAPGGMMFELLRLPGSTGGEARFAVTAMDFASPAWRAEFSLEDMKASVDECGVTAPEGEEIVEWYQEAYATPPRWVPDMRVEDDGPAPGPGLVAVWGRAQLRLPLPPRGRLVALDGEGSQGAQRDVTFRLLRRELEHRAGGTRERPEGGGAEVGAEGAAEVGRGGIRGGEGEGGGAPPPVRKKRGAARVVVVPKPGLKRKGALLEGGGGRAGGASGGVKEEPC